MHSVAVGHEALALTPGSTNVAIGWGEFAPINQAIICEITPVFPSYKSARGVIDSSHNTKFYIVHVEGCHEPVIVLKYAWQLSALFVRDKGLYLRNGMIPIFEKMHPRWFALFQFFLQEGMLDIFSNVVSNYIPMHMAMM